MPSQGLAAKVKARRELPTPTMRRALRVDARLSLEDVAREVGVTRQAVSRWELGARAPRGRNLDAYAAVLASLRGGKEAPTG
jgi:DNA-binding transcriptional regulator YiaG